MRCELKLVGYFLFLPFFLSLVSCGSIGGSSYEILGGDLNFSADGTTGRGIALSKEELVLNSSKNLKAEMTFTKDNGKVTFYLYGQLRGKEGKAKRFSDEIKISVRRELRDLHVKVDANGNGSSSSYKDFFQGDENEETATFRVDVHNFYDEKGDDDDNISYVHHWDPKDKRFTKNSSNETKGSSGEGKRWGFQLYGEKVILKSVSLGTPIIPRDKVVLF